MKINVRFIKGQDQWVDDIAHIHYSSMLNDFLPSLGIDFLRKVFYPYVLHSQYGVSIVAIDNERPIGFVVVAHESSKFTKNFLEKNLFKITLYAIRAVLKNPRKMVDYIEIIITSLFGSQYEINCEIVFIAVHEKYRSMGIGKQLVTASMKYIQEKGYSRIRIKTLTSNETWINMFINLGWVILKKIRLFGKEYTVLTCNV